MEKIERALRMCNIHSDIRGPLFMEAMKMQEQGIDILKLNTGNPATFGFGLPKSIENALKENLEKGVGYCDFRGMPEARRAICEYEKGKGISGITPDDVFIGNGVSEVVSFALFPLLIHLSNSDLLNFHIFPILCAGISVFLIQFLTVSFVIPI